MTVQQLIDKLQECPFKDAEVAVEKQDDFPQALKEVLWYQGPQFCVFLVGTED